MLVIRRNGYSAPIIQEITRDGNSDYNNAEIKDEEKCCYTLFILIVNYSCRLLSIYIRVELHKIYTIYMPHS